MKGIVVLGCYRSGSSAVAGILHHLGVFMGEKFDDPSKGNPRGYFEDIEFKDLHKLAMEGKDVSEEYQKLLDERCGWHGPYGKTRLTSWGLKDPRLCILLPKLPLNPDYVICTHRPTHDIANSLHKVLPRESKEKWLILINHFLAQRDLWLQTYRGPVMDVRFQELMSNPYRMVQTIATFVSVPFLESAVKFISCP